MLSVLYIFLLLLLAEVIHPPQQNCGGYDALCVGPIYLCRLGYFPSVLVCNF